MTASSNFQVDLHGIVDLLSHHIYSSPRVYLRELLQNAVDAITARQLDEPGCVALVSIETGDGSLQIRDTGIGLGPDEVGELLATIGRSSKRDQIGFAREEFLGQFGIGLLSAFMVADEITVVTRRADGPATRWVGTADGRYTVAREPGEHPIGTTVRLTARRGAEHWFDAAMVRDLAMLFGSLLPIELTVDGDVITEGPAPWDDGLDVNNRKVAQATYAQDVLGYTPFDVVELSVPTAGLVGVAYVLPFQANPTQRATHRVYMKRMLLAEYSEGLLPDWAFFVRCVIDTSELRPTASREALYEDSLLEETRTALADQLRAWLVRLGRTNPIKLSQFLGIHQVGVKAMALHDDAMLEIVDRWVSIETTMGRMTLAEARERQSEIRYTSTVEDFRQVSAVAAAQGLLVVNGGRTFDADLIERLPDLDPEIVVERFDPTELATRFEALDPVSELTLRPFVASAQRALDAVGCEVIVRAFDPPGLTAMFLVDRSAAFASELRATRERADALWSAVLSAVDKADETRPQLVLNHRSHLVRRLVALADEEVIRLAIEGLYGHALMAGHHPIRPADAALVNRSFLGLLDQAVPQDAKDS